MDSNYTILLTIDVEDWFQVENFKHSIPFSSWDQYELRVERNIHRLLNLFDSVELEPPSFPASQPPILRKPKATFFVLAWIAERLPHLIREIQNRGHEVASHGCDHVLINRLPYKEVTNEIHSSKRILEDIIGATITGFRAPSFSIDDSILKIVEDAGYFYDSSYNSFKMHGRYGAVNLKHNSKKEVAVEVSEKFYELPISNLNLLNCIIPLGGGAYFRLIPYFLFKLGIQNILRKEKAYLFYLHPWEIDPEQPRVNHVSPYYRFRHYHNLEKNFLKIEKLFKSFSICNYSTCRDYISYL